MPPGCVLIRHRPEPYGYYPDGDPAPPAPAPMAQSPDAGLPEVGVGEAVRSPAFWIIAAVLGVHYMGPSAVFIVRVPYFEGVGFSTAAAASTIGAFTVLSAIGRLGTGFLLDRCDRRFVVAGLLACDLGGLLVLVNITEYWMVFPSALLFGLGFGGMLPSRNVLVSEYFRARRFGSIYGLLGSASVVFGIAAPLMVGWSQDLTGSYRSAFLAVALCLALAVPLPLLLKRHANRNP